jgi:hypothetical protein
MLICERVVSDNISSGMPLSGSVCYLFVMNRIVSGLMRCVVARLVCCLMAVSIANISFPSSLLLLHFLFHSEAVF